MKPIKFFSLKLIFYLLAGGLVIIAATAMANPPHNDSYDNSVEEVVSYHVSTEFNPDSVKYLFWSPVTMLDNGNFKVTVVFLSKNRFQRKVKKKQIVFMNETGNVLKTLECR